MQGGAKKILIVEDEKALAKVFELKLQHAGFSPTVAKDGEVALELLEKETFDLILLDLVMPKLDGFGVLRSLQERKNVTPVVVISNLSQSEDFERATALGAKKYFVKSDMSIAEVVHYVKEELHV